MDAGLKLSSHNHARVEYSKLLKNDMIEQLQMGVSTIATALVQLLCKASTLVAFAGEMGMAHSGIALESFIFAKEYHHS